MDENRSGISMRMAVRLGVVACMLIWCGIGDVAPVRAEPSVQSSAIPVDLEGRLPELRQSLLDLAELDASYAGNWVDLATGQIVIAFAGDDPARDLRLLDAAPPELKGRVSVQLVRLSATKLKEAKGHIVKSLGVNGIEGVGIDYAHNGLVVLSSEPATSRAALDKFQGLGVPFSVIEGRNDDNTCANRLNCGGTSARRGGVSLNRSGLSCTSGPNVIAAGVRYATTAGHCWYGTNSGSVTSGTQSFGSLNSWGQALYPGTYCDCRIVQASAGVTVANRTYYSNALPYVYVNNKVPYSSIGDAVRLLGRSSFTVGNVQYVEYSYIGDSCGCTVNGGTLATYTSIGGDSGGAVTSENGATIRGLHSGNSGGLGRFTEVANIEAYLGVSVMTAP